MAFKWLSRLFAKDAFSVDVQDSNDSTTLQQSTSTVLPSQRTKYTNPFRQRIALTECPSCGAPVEILRIPALRKHLNDPLTDLDVMVERDVREVAAFEKNGRLKVVLMGGTMAHAGAVRNKSTQIVELAQEVHSCKKHGGKSSITPPSYIKYWPDEVVSHCDFSNNGVVFHDPVWWIVNNDPNNAIKTTQKSIITPGGVSIYIESWLKQNGFKPFENSYLWFHKYKN